MSIIGGIGRRCADMRREDLTCEQDIPTFLLVFTSPTTGLGVFARTMASFAQTCPRCFPSWLSLDSLCKFQFRTKPYSSLALTDYSYALYLVVGLVALFRDFDVKASDEVDEVHAKHVDNEVPIRPTAVELSDSHQISHGRSIHTQPSSAYDSSVAEMSGNTSMTMPPSTEASNSLVTAGSARSSALISSGSSELPAYSGRISMVESQRRSGEEQPQDGSFSRPAMVYFRAEHISLA